MLSSRKAALFWKRRGREKNVSSFPESFKYVSVDRAFEKLWPEGRVVFGMQHTWKGDRNLSPTRALSRPRQDAAFSNKTPPKDLDARQFSTSLPRKWFSGQLFLEWVFLCLSRQGWTVKSVSPEERAEHGAGAGLRGTQESYGSSQHLSKCFSTSISFPTSHSSLMKPMAVCPFRR